MPSIPQIYERYTHGAFYRNLGEWMRYCTHPWRLGECRIYTEPNYLTCGTDIWIRFERLPDAPFLFGFRSDDILEWGEDGLLEKLVEAFEVKFRAFYIPPEDHIELGEN
jgi:hypothetical protein